jgi:hypothetical protein
LREFTTQRDPSGLTLSRTPDPSARTHSRPSHRKRPPIWLPTLPDRDRLQQPEDDEHDKT